ncbi:MAG: glycosyltransferase, partial [Candidatus Kryptonium sp.]
MIEKLNISVVIHTYNEERNIRNCLESVKWAEEILVCDMYSEDRTVEIAREYTDRIVFFERVGYVEPARQYAVNQT